MALGLGHERNKLANATYGSQMTSGNSQTDGQWNGSLDIISSWITDTVDYDTQEEGNHSLNQNSLADRHASIDLGVSQITENFWWCSDLLRKIKEKSKYLSNKEILIPRNILGCIVLCMEKKP